MSYVIKTKGGQRGPVSQEVLIELVRSGRIAADTAVFDVSAQRVIRAGVLVDGVDVVDVAAEAVREPALAEMLFSKMTPGQWTRPASARTQRSGSAPGVQGGDARCDRAIVGAKATTGAQVGIAVGDATPSDQHRVIGKDPVVPAGGSGTVRARTFRHPAMKRGKGEIGARQTVSDGDGGQVSRQRGPVGRTGSGIDADHPFAPPRYDARGRDAAPREKQGAEDDRDDWRPPDELQPIGDLYGVSLLLHGLSVVGVVIITLSEYRLYQLLVDFQAGGATAADVRDYAGSQMVYSWIAMVVSLFHAIVFLSFLFRSHRNAECVSGRRLKISAWRMIGWFFVPVANLWKPYGVIWDMARLLIPRAGSRWVGIWWYLWIVSVVGSTAVNGATRLSSSVGAVRQCLLASMVVGVVQLLLLTASACMITALMWPQHGAWRLSRVASDQGL